MNIVDRFHLVRRVLLVVFVCLFLFITYKIFFDGIVLDTFKIGVYYFFGGIVLFIVKWYHNSRDKEGEIK